MFIQGVKKVTLSVCDTFNTLYKGIKITLKNKYAEVRMRIYLL